MDPDDGDAKMVEEQQDSRSSSAVGSTRKRKRQDLTCPEAMDDLLQFLGTSVPPGQQERLVETMKFGPDLCDDCGKCALCGYSASPTRVEYATIDVLRAGILSDPRHYVDAVSRSLMKEWQHGVARELRRLILDRVSVGDYLYASFWRERCEKYQAAILRVVNKTYGGAADSPIGYEAELVCFRRAARGNARLARVETMPVEHGTLQLTGPSFCPHQPPLVAREQGRGGHRHRQPRERHVPAQSGLGVRAPDARDSGDRCRRTSARSLGRD